MKVRAGNVTTRESVRVLAVVLGVFFAVAHDRLPPDGWVTGDQGSKYLQTHAFATNGPLNPGIDVLSRDLDPEYRYQEPKMKNRRGRLVSEFLWLLPLLTAPFYGVFGLRGLYVLPALSVVVIAVAAGALARQLADVRGWWLPWVTVFSTPVIVYGLEFWEHAPAAACVMIAAVLAYPHDSTRRRVQVRLFAAGAAIGLGALFREEVIVALPAFALARAVSLPGSRLRAAITGAVWTGAGAAAVFVSAIPVNLLIYGTLLPMHMTEDAWEVAKAVPYLQVRRDILWTLMLPADHVAPFAGAILVGAAAALMQAMRQRRSNDGIQPDATTRVLLAVVHTAVAVLLVIVVILPLWRMVMVRVPGDAYRITSAAHTWIFALPLLYWPWFRDVVNPRAARFIVLSAMLMIGVMCILVPTDGGSQWSPRYFVPAAPLFALVAAVAVLRVPVAAVVLLASVAMQATGVGWVKHSKTYHSRFTTLVAAQTPPGAVLISDIHWVPELTATLARTRRFLFSWTPGQLPALAQRAAAAGYRSFYVISSPQVTGYAAPLIIEFQGLPCRYARGEPVETSRVLISEYSCR